MEPRTVVKLYCNWFQQAQAKEINNYVIAPCRILETIVEKSFQTQNVIKYLAMARTINLWAVNGCAKRNIYLKT